MLVAFKRNVNDAVPLGLRTSTPHSYKSGRSHRLDIQFYRLSKEIAQAPAVCHLHPGRPFRLTGTPIAEWHTASSSVRLATPSVRNPRPFVSNIGEHWSGSWRDGSSRRVPDRDCDLNILEGSEYSVFNATEGAALMQGISNAVSSL